MKRKKPKADTPKEELLDMTPMIDVTFLLLIFFIVTLKFKTLEGRLSAALPKDVGVNPTPAEPIEKVDVRIEVIDPGERVGAFPFNGNFAFVHTHTGDGTRHEYQGHPRHDFRGRRLAYHVLGRKFTNLDDLYARFQKLYEKDPERPAAIDAPEGVAVIDVIPVLDRLTTAGFRDINFRGYEDPKK